MSSALDPDPMTRLRRFAPVSAGHVRTRAGLGVLFLVLAPVTALAAPRAVPVLPGLPVLAVADRSSDPLANAPLRGRVSAPASGAQSMFRSSAPVATPAGSAPAPAESVPAQSPPPLAGRPAQSPAPLGAASAPAPARPGAALGLRERTVTPADGVRSAIPYQPAGAQPAHRGTPAVVHPGEPTRPAAGVAPAGGAVAATGMAETAAAAPVATPPPAIAAAGQPVTATLQPDGTLLLTWTVPGNTVADPYLVTILGPDEQTAMRTVRTQGGSWSYSPQAQQIDFGLPVTDRVCVRVRSASDGAGAVNAAPICIQVAPAS